MAATPCIRTGPSIGRLAMSDRRHTHRWTRMAARAAIRGAATTAGSSLITLTLWWLGRR